MSDKGAPKVTVWLFSLTTNDVSEISSELTWEDVVEQELGDRTLTSNGTMTSVAFGPYVVRLDAGSIMRGVPVNKAWAKMFELAGSPVRCFHGPIVMFHSGEFAVNWDNFKRYVTEHFDEELSKIALTKLEEVSNDEDENKDEQ